MGIKDLYQVIKKHAPDELRTFHLSEFRGHRFAIDISIFLNKYVKSAGGKGWMNTFFLFLCTLKKHGIKSVAVFDGPNPPIEKKLEQEARRAQGQKAIARLDRCKEIRAILIEDYIPTDKCLGEAMRTECEILYGKPKKNVRDVVWSECTDVLDAMNSTITRLETQTAPITAEHRELAKRISVMMGIPVFQADGEAEALCAHLAIHDYVDAVLTEDTDVLAYGTPWMVAFKSFKLSDEKLFAIHLPSLRSALGYDQDELRDLCILLSCDYNERVKGFLPGAKKPVSFGAAKAVIMIDEYRRLEEVVKHVVDPAPLLFRRCREIFTPPSSAETKELVKIMPHNIKPNFALIRKFMKDQNLSMGIDYIEKCWTPGEIAFDGDSDGEDVEDIEEEEDIEDLLAAVRDKVVIEEKCSPRYYVKLSAICQRPDGEDTLVELAVGFATKKDCEDYEDGDFEDLIEPINEWFALDDETGALRIDKEDSSLEVESVYSQKPDIRILEV